MFWWKQKSCGYWEIYLKWNWHKVWFQYDMNIILMLLTNLFTRYAQNCKQVMQTGHDIVVTSWDIQNMFSPSSTNICWSIHPLNLMEAFQTKSGEIWGLALFFKWVGPPPPLKSTWELELFKKRNDPLKFSWNKFNMSLVPSGTWDFFDFRRPPPPNFELFPT